MRAQQAARLMKGIDPNIELVLCGSSGRRLDTYLEWDRIALEYCWEDVEYISAHRYSRIYENDSDWFLAEGVEIERILQDYDGLVNYVRGVRKSDKRVYVSFDEWNVWYKNMERDGNWTVGAHLIEEVYNLEDAIICAQYLNAFLRHADLVKVACLAQLVNVIGPILTRPDGLLIQSIYYPFLFYRKFANGLSLTPVVDSPTYKAGARSDVPVLDASATYDDANRCAAVFIVNRSQRDSQEVAVSFTNAKIMGVLDTEQLTGGDAKAFNTWENPDVIKPSKASATLDDDGGVRVQVPSLGLVALSLQVG
jgi:alpha-N-arabinofuranosidase